MFYIPEPLARGYKTHNEFHKYRMKWKFISDSFYHMIIPKNINISWKSMYFEKIPRENRPEASCFTRRHNAPSYDVTGKGARNCSKKCYVTCHIGKFMKWLYERENHVINIFIIYIALLKHCTANLIFSSFFTARIYHHIIQGNPLRC